MAKKRRKPDRVYESDEPFDVRRAVREFHEDTNKPNYAARIFGVIVLIGACVVGFVGRGMVSPEARGTVAVVAIVGAVIGVVCLAFSTRSDD